VTDLAHLVESVLADEALFGADGPCPVRAEEGAHPRLLLVTGGNAGGKSLVCRFLNQKASEAKVEFMRVGMGRRTRPGIERSFIFGHDEDRESTGRVSANAVRGGINTCRGREHPHYLCLDEPDVGLSDEMQGGLGALLAGFAADMPDKTLGLVVVTHSRHVAKALLALSPRCLRVGDDLRPTAEWASAEPRPASAEAFLALGSVATGRLRAVQAVLDGRKPPPGRAPR
jgi:hypothetical protein